MISRSPTTLLMRAHDRWRDRVLTGLTLLMALDFFMIAPARTIDAFDFRAFSIAIVILLSGALVLLSRSLAPIVAIVGAFALFIATLILRSQAGHSTIDACLEASAWLVVSLVVIWVAARAVFAPGRITYHRVIGAILVYLTIGLVFVALYTLVGPLSPPSFSGLRVIDRTTLPSDLIYFSFATLTSVGYGDIVPIHPFARSLSNLEAIIGQLYPATLLARLVSLGQRDRSE
jgi:hypothetical protein